MATDNKGLSGCPSYDDMIYTSSLGFSVVGDNGGHNNTEYLGMDAQQFLNNNELVIDWSHRARHAAVVAGKQVIKTDYGQAASYNYGQLLPLPMDLKEHNTTTMKVHFP
jgi:feruloyl esterase